MRDGGHPIVRRVATGFLTGPAGRLAAFSIDLGTAAARYWGCRLTGRETPW